MSKKRSKKFGKKRAPAAMADGGDSAGVQVDDAEDSDDIDAEALAAAVGTDGVDAGDANLDAAIAVPVLAEGSLATDVSDANGNTIAQADDTAAREAPTKRSKKSKKAAALEAASEALRAVPEVEGDSEVEVDSASDVASAESPDEVAAVAAVPVDDNAVELPNKGGKKTKAGKAKSKAKRDADADAASDEFVTVADSDAHDVDAGGAADGIDVDLAVRDAATADELAAAGNDDDAVVDAVAPDDADSNDGIDVEMPGMLDGEGTELAAVGEGDVEGEDAESELPAAAAAMDAAQLAQLIEALIFATDKPLTVQRIRQLTRVADVNRITAALAKIAVDYADRGIVLSSVSGGYQFRTRSQFSSWVQQLIAGRPVRLSRAQLEALAIIAYRQPITRPEIDEIRGVDSGGTLKVLLDRQLIRSLGKKEEVGRPVLYGTTKEFLDFFSLGDLRELPTLREYSELTDESRSVMKKMGLDADTAPASSLQGIAPDAAAAFEAMANAAEIAEEFGDIGEVGDLDELSDMDADAQFGAAGSRSGVMEDDGDGAAVLDGDDDLEATAVVDASDEQATADDYGTDGELPTAADQSDREALDAAAAAGDEAVSAAPDVDDDREALDAAATDGDESAVGAVPDVDDERALAAGRGAGAEPDAEAEPGVDAAEAMHAEDEPGAEPDDALGEGTVDGDADPGFDLANLSSDDDDDDVELPSWVVPVVEDSAPVDNATPEPSLQMHGDHDDDALNVEVTRDGEWVAGASELVEPTDEVAADQFDDDAS